MELSLERNFRVGRFRGHLLWGVVAICLLPSVLNLLGMDFGIQNPDGSSIAGPIVHSLLEWSAFTIAILIGVLSILHYGVRKESVTPIIGLALLSAGFMDAFHTLAAGQLLSGAADAQNFIPFTWAISRVFNVVVMSAGVGLILFERDESVLRGPRYVLGVGVAFAVLAYAVIHVFATRPALPQTMFPEHFITRPWDFAPLVLFVVAGLTIYPALCRRYPSHFATAIWIGVIPEIATQVHMTFGSVALFDNHFNIAHFLKILAYIIPLGGLLYDWAQTYASERRATVELDGARNRWEKLARSASDVIMRSDRKGVVDFLSRDLPNLQVPPAIGQPASIWMSDMDRRQFAKHLSQSVEEGTSQGMEALSLASDGRQVWFWCKLTPVVEGGRVDHVVVSLTDISDRKKQDEKVTRLASMVAQTGEAMVSISATGMVDTWNPAAEQLFGYAGKEARGRHISFLMPEEGRSAHHDLLAKLAMGEEIPPQQTVRLAKSGAPIAVQIALTRLSDQHGTFRGAVAVIRDVRKEQKLSQALRDAKEAAESTSAATSRFLANMSHEIRTPLNGVLGMIQLIRATTLDSEQQEYADTLGVSSRAVLSVINDILDHAKIDAGQLEFESTPFNLSTAVQETTAMFLGAAHEAGLELNCEIDDRLPAFVVGDSHRLGQVLSNLVGNAIKFTAQGRVGVSARLAQDPGSRHLIRFEVSDTGLGMTRATMDRIFKPFAQADSSTTRDYGGTGLGLAICSQLVEGMGGEIGVESVSGVGSKFWLTLPLEQADAPATPEAGSIEAPSDSRPRMRNTSVLVVEDNRINQKVIEAMLRKSGCEVELVSNGLEALAICAARNFDVVFMDCQMPEMGGLEATRRLREMEGCKELPIVALTAQALEDDREECLAAGMSDYLSKPVEWTALNEMLAKWAAGDAGDLGRDRAPRPVGRPSAKFPSKAV